MFIRARNASSRVNTPRFSVRQKHALWVKTNACDARKDTINPELQQQQKLTIIGGGISGLLSAFFALKSPTPPSEITILESNDRLGGKILTRFLESEAVGKVPYNAGAAEFYDYCQYRSLYRLMTQLGLKGSPLSESSRQFFRDKSISNAQEFEQYFGKEELERLNNWWNHGVSLMSPKDFAWSSPDHPWRRRTFAEILDEGLGSDSAAREFVERQVNSDLCVDPRHTYGSFGFENLLLNCQNYTIMFKLLDTKDRGNEVFIDHIAETLKDCVDIQLNTHVERIVASSSTDHPSGCKYSVEYHKLEDSSEKETSTVMNTDGLVIAIPLENLQKLDIRAENTCSPAHAKIQNGIQRHVDHFYHPASYLRVSFLFQERFWKNELERDYFLDDSFNGVTVYDQSPELSNYSSNFSNSNSPGILSWLLGGTIADEMCSLSDQEIIEKVVSSTKFSHKSCLQQMSDLVLDAKVDRWVGGVSGVPNGWNPSEFGLAERHQVSPEFPSLVITGDYFDDSTICGAISSAALAVNCVCLPSMQGEDVSQQTDDQVEAQADAFLLEQGLVTAAELDDYVTKESDFLSAGTDKPTQTRTDQGYPFITDYSNKTL